MRLLLLVSLVTTSACSTPPDKDMTNYQLWDFQNENYCDKTSQCRSVLWGRGECGNYPYGAAGYFIYSTKIGARNMRHLKKLAKESLPSKDRDLLNMSDNYELVECLPIGMKKPKLICENNQCQETW